MNKVVDAIYFLMFYAYILYRSKYSLIVCVCACVCVCMF